MKGGAHCRDSESARPDRARLERLQVLKQRSLVAFGKRLWRIAVASVAEAWRIRVVIVAPRTCRIGRFRESLDLDPDLVLIVAIRSSPPGFRPLVGIEKVRPLLFWRPRAAKATSIFTTPSVWKL
jgi:hypothetical protein